MAFLHGCGRSALFPGLFSMLVLVTCLSGLQNIFLPCSLLAPAKAFLCSAFRLHYDKYFLPVSKKSSHNNAPQTRSKTAVRHAACRALPITVACMVSLAPSSASPSNHPLSCLMFRFLWGKDFLLCLHSTTQNGTLLCT